MTPTSDHPGADPRSAHGAAQGAPGLLLRAEGLALLAGAAVAYGALGGGWGLFALLLLAPDLAMVGYLAGPRSGAALYNAAHATLGPWLLGALGWWLGSEGAVLLALVWAAHIGLDRAAGYGLKYARGFWATHLGGLRPSPAPATP